MSGYPPLDAWGGLPQHAAGAPAPQQAYPPIQPGAAGHPQQQAAAGGAPPPPPSYPLPAAPAPYQQAPASPYHAQQPASPYHQQQQPAGPYHAQQPAGPYQQQQPSSPYQQPPLQQHHHQQPQHPQPAGPSSGPGGEVAVIDRRFCLPQAVDLVLQETPTMGASSYGGDNFAVTDTQGRVYFYQAARTFSARDRRVLLDASGQPVVGMARKHLALKPTWLVYRGGSFSDAALVARVASNFSLAPSVSVYLNDGDAESDFKLRGDFRSKRFTFSQKLGGGRERAVAAVRRESRFASAAAFLAAAVARADKYFLSIEPGVDAAFIVALALLCDELFHDPE